MADYNRFLNRFEEDELPIEIQQAFDPNAVVNQPVEEANPLAPYMNQSSVSQGFPIEVPQEPVLQARAPSPQPSLQPLDEQVLPPPQAPVAPPSNREVQDTSMERIMKLLKPQESKPISIDVGQDDRGSVDHLIEAQKAKNIATLANQLGASASIVGAGIAMANPSEPALRQFDNNIKQAQSIVTDFEKQIEQQKFDPNSAISKAYKNYLARTGVNVKGDFTAAIGEKLLPAAVQQQIRQDDRLAKQQNLALALMQRMDAKRDRQDEVHQKQAQLNPKQVEEISQFDESATKMQNVLESLGDKSEWVGPVDGRIPDMLTPSEQVAFRSTIGRMQDAYRKLITGAGAGMKEIARLEANLPRSTDTYDNFVSKAKAFVKEVQSMKNVKLNNLQKSGKDVEEFRDMSSPSQEPKSPQSLNKPKTVTQGGHVYTLNEATGEYE